VLVQVVRLVEAVNRAFITHGLQPFYEVGAGGVSVGKGGSLRGQQCEVQATVGNGKQVEGLHGGCAGPCFHSAI
jgi:hypothetical protein